MEYYSSKGGIAYGIPNGDERDCSTLSCFADLSQGICTVITVKGTYYYSGESSGTGTDVFGFNSSLPEDTGTFYNTVAPTHFSPLYTVNKSDCTFHLNYDDGGSVIGYIGPGSISDNFRPRVLAFADNEGISGTDHRMF
jgi:hypothetical protein